MYDINLLKKATEEFFQKYLSPKSGDYPKWSEKWNFNEGIPYNNKRGCYALVNDDEVRYIGVGIGRSSERYDGCGLGDRLKRYYQLNKDSANKNKYKLRNEWEANVKEEFKVNGIITIGFEDDYWPLAAALEIYLITKLEPVLNKSFNNKTLQ